MFINLVTYGSCIYVKTVIGPSGMVESSSPVPVDIPCGTLRVIAGSLRPLVMTCAVRLVIVH